MSVVTKVWQRARRRSKNIFDQDQWLSRKEKSKEGDMGAINEEDKENVQG